MIPESGTREELRAAWFDAITMPLRGEVYQTSVIWDTSRSPEVWRVREVCSHRVPQVVVIDVYRPCPDVSMFERTFKDYDVPFTEWLKFYQAKALQYVGMNLPRVP